MTEGEFREAALSGFLEGLIERALRSRSPVGDK